MRIPFRLAAQLDVERWRWEAEETVEVRASCER